MKDNKYDPKQQQKSGLNQQPNQQQKDRLNQQPQRPNQGIPSHQQTPGKPFKKDDTRK